MFRRSFQAKNLAKKLQKLGMNDGLPYVNELSLAKENRRAPTQAE
jgi:hypothetical protein